MARRQMDLKDLLDDTKVDIIVEKRMVRQSNLERPPLYRKIVSKDSPREYKICNTSTQ